MKCKSDTVPKFELLINVLMLHLSVLKVGRVAIITRGRYAGKKVRIGNQLQLGRSHKSRSEELLARGADISFIGRDYPAS